MVNANSTFDPVCLLPLVVISSNVSRVQYQAISTQPGMDIWSIKKDTVDVRISRESEMWLKQLGVYCIIVHESVELLVQQFEQKLTVQKQEWFKEYVSISIYVAIPGCAILLLKTAAITCMASWTQNMKCQRY